MESTPNPPKIHMRPLLRTMLDANIRAEFITAIFVHRFETSGYMGLKMKIPIHIIVDEGVLENTL